MDYSIVFALGPEASILPYNFINFEINRLTMITCYCFGAVGKSAQVISYMVTRCYEGPTPVSALIHAATLAAGVFLIIRCLAYLNIVRIR